MAAAFRQINTKWSLLWLAVMFAGFLIAGCLQSDLYRGLRAEHRAVEAIDRVEEAVDLGWPDWRTSARSYVQGCSGRAGEFVDCINFPTPAYARISYPLDDEPVPEIAVLATEQLEAAGYEALVGPTCHEIDGYPRADGVFLAPDGVAVWFTVNRRGMGTIRFSVLADYDSGDLIGSEAVLGDDDVPTSPNDGDWDMPGDVSCQSMVES